MKKIHIPILISLPILLICNLISAQNFRLVKDINTESGSSLFNTHTQIYPREILPPATVMNQVWYFSANDGTHGTELWRSDGTANGTFIVKDISTGVSSSNPLSITVCGKRIFFKAWQAGREGLWISDGTASGTKLVRNLSAIRNLIAADSVVYFVSGSELWKSDGTETGTLKTISLLSEKYHFSRLQQLFWLRNRLYFTTADLLWESDGTDKATNVVSGEATDAEQLIMGPGNAVFFTAKSGYNSKRQLWYIDTVTNTSKRAFNNDSIDCFFASPLIKKNQTILFTGSKEGFPTSLYSYTKNTNSNLGYDLRILSNKSSFGIANITISNNKIFYTASLIDSIGGRNYQLWKSGFETNNAEMLKNDCNPENLKIVDDTLYFSAIDNNGFELWKSDGTISGTKMIKDLWTGNQSSFPGQRTGFVDVNGMIIFAANGGNSEGIELWKTDGSAEGTTLLKNINDVTTSSSTPHSLTVYKNRLFFNAFISELSTPQFLNTDGNEIDLDNPGNIRIPYLRREENISISNNKLFFYGINSLTNEEGLFKSDGTVENTELVKKFSGSRYNIRWVSAQKSLIYLCFYNDAINKTYLWRSDGTTEGTFLLNNSDSILIVDGDRRFAPKGVGDYFYFIKRSLNGYMLWKTDGTDNGTMAVKGLSETPLILNLCEFKNALYFFSEGASYFTYSLWKTDGTESGTQPILDGLQNVANLTANNETLFFSAKLTNSSLYKRNLLWRSDGTTNGTHIVKDIDVLVNQKPFYGKINCIFLPMAHSVQMNSGKVMVLKPALL